MQITTRSILPLLLTAFLGLPSLRGVATGALLEDGGTKVPTAPTVSAIPLAAPSDTVGFSLMPGSKPSVQMVLEFTDGRSKTLKLDVYPQTGKRRLPAPAGTKPAKPAYEEVKAEDSYVAVSGMNLRIFARPNLFRYTDPQQDDLLQRWDRLPGASQTFVHYEFRNRPGQLEMWINGYPKPAYVAMAAVTNVLDQVTFRRKVPTDSLTAYAMEFDRADGRRAYALWTPRASVEMALEFPPDASLERTASRLPRRVRHAGRGQPRAAAGRATHARALGERQLLVGQGGLSVRGRRRQRLAHACQRMARLAGRAVDQFRRLASHPVSHRYAVPAHLLVAGRPLPASEGQRPPGNLSPPPDQALRGHESQSGLR